MADEITLGVDLGTTFSAMAYINRHGMPEVIPNAEGKRTTPSVVYFDQDGSVVVGQIAKNQAIADPARTVQFIKREMGNSSFRLAVDGVDHFPEDISALILRKLLDDARAHLDADVQRAVISVPAYFKDAQRRATQLAGEIAGIEVVAILNEPTAAALAYGFGKSNQRQTILIYDFGGGTFDVTILGVNEREFTVLATDGDSHLGGVDADSLLADHLAEQYQAHHGIDLRLDLFSRQDLWERAETAKIDLSARQSVMVTLGAGADAMRVDLDREKLDELIADLLMRTEVRMESAVRSANLDWSAIDSVLLVGGSTRIQAVQDLVTRVTKKDPAKDVNPDECVAVGAALRAAMPDVSEGEARVAGPGPGPSRDVSDIVIRDVAPHSLGVRALTAEGQPINSIIIPRLTPVPCERKRTYATRVDDQASIEVEVLQGENEDPFSPDVEPIGRVRMDDLPSRPAGEVVIAIALRYDANGVVEVEAEELVEGRAVRQQLLRKTGELDEELIASFKQRIENPPVSPQAPDEEPPPVEPQEEPEPTEPEAVPDPTEPEAVPDPTEPDQAPQLAGSEEPEVSPQPDADTPDLQGDAEDEAAADEDEEEPAS